MLKNYEIESLDVICKDASQQDTLVCFVISPVHIVTQALTLFEIKTIHEAHETKLFLFAWFGVILWIALLGTGTKHESKLRYSSSEMA